MQTKFFPSELDVDHTFNTMSDDVLDDVLLFTQVSHQPLVIQLSATHNPSDHFQA